MKVKEYVITSEEFEKAKAHEEIAENLINNTIKLLRMINVDSNISDLGKALAEGFDQAYLIDQSEHGGRGHELIFKFK